MTFKRRLLGDFAKNWTPERPFPVEIHQLGDDRPEEDQRNDELFRLGPLHKDQSEVGSDGLFPAAAAVIVAATVVSIVAIRVFYSTAWSIFDWSRK